MSKTRKKPARVYKNPFVIMLGKTIRSLARIKGGGGSAIPGVVVDKIAPKFLTKALASLPCGVVVISGTNGKTTTTKIVTELLQSFGLKVLTNDTGSNFKRGVIAAMLSKITTTGRLDADIAVLELDEAHAVHFVSAVAPHYSMLLNVMPDQLDRFGTVEYTASLLKKVAQSTQRLVVLNREDKLLADPGFIDGVCAVRYFGLSEQLKQRFFISNGLEPADHFAKSEQLPADVILAASDSSAASFKIAGKTYSRKLALKGLHNAYNSAAALVLVRQILRDNNVLTARLDTQDSTSKQALTSTHTADNKNDEFVADYCAVSKTDCHLVKALAQIKSAFGRGETFLLDGRQIEMLLVKNSGGFNLALESFDTEDCIIMIAVNDMAGDGRDISWLYDVDFSTLCDNDVVMLCGTRAHEMALRLSYDEVGFESIETDVVTALNCVIESSKYRQRPIHIFCTYTSMMKLRAQLSALCDKNKKHDQGVKDSKQVDR